MNVMGISRAVADAGSGRLQAGAACVVSPDTPAALTDAGMRQLPMIHPSGHVIRELAPISAGGHGVAAADLARLRELMSHPVCVIRSSAGNEARIVVLRAADSEGSPLAAIVAEGTVGNEPGGRRANVLLSLHGRPSIGTDLLRALADGRALILDHDAAGRLVDGQAPNGSTLALLTRLDRRAGSGGGTKTIRENRSRNGAKGRR